MPAITDFASLQEEVAGWLEREGDTSLSDRLPSIVQAAESWFNRKLAGYQREVEIALTTDASGKAALPAGFVGIKTVEQNGRPWPWSISGSSIRISGASAGSFDVVYKSRLVALDDTNTSNWLLEAAPDAYLYACMAQASVMLENFTSAAIYASQAESILSDLNLQSTVAQYGMASLQIPGGAPATSEIGSPASTL